MRALTILILLIIASVVLSIPINLDIDKDTYNVWKGKSNIRRRTLQQYISDSHDNLIEKQQVSTLVVHSTDTELKGVAFHRYLGTYKGLVKGVYWLYNHSGYDLVIIGRNYVSRNGSREVLFLEGNVLSWLAVDVNNDSNDELFVCTTKKIYLLSENLKVIWKADNPNGRVNRMYIASLFPNRSPILIRYEMDSNFVAYIDTYDGLCLKTVRLLDDSNDPVNIRFLTTWEDTIYGHKSMVYCWR